MRRATTVRRAFAGLLTLSVISTGCTRPEPSTSNSSPTVSNNPSADDILQYSNRWIQNPAMDLMSPEGTFVRAAVESLDRVGYGRGTGIAAIADAGYPGFYAPSIMSGIPIHSDSLGGKTRMRSGRCTGK